jgi:hypothetical protein
MWGSVVFTHTLKKEYMMMINTTDYAIIRMS